MLDKISVLYIEDDLDIADEVSFFLEKQVSKLYIGANGEEGLELFRKFPVDIIITDIQMPRMSGLDMIKIIREENSSIPIIILSAFNETEKLLSAIDLGVDAYMLKPINLSQLIKKIEKLIQPLHLQNKLDDSNLKLELMEKLEAKEIELLKYKERMDYAFAGSNDGLWDWNILTGETYFSPRWKEIIGYEDKEIENIHASGLQTIYPDDIALVEKAIEKAFTSKNANYTVEFRQVHKDGHLVWILSRGLVTLDKAGKPIRMIGTHTDITHKKDYEDKLLQAKNDLSQAQKLTHIGSWKWNILTNDLQWSDEVFRIFGEKEQSFEPRYEKFLSYIPEDYQVLVTQAIENSLEDKNIPYNIIHPIIRENGERRFVKEIGIVTYNEDSKATGMLGTIHDITAEKLNEEATLKYQRQLELSAEIAGTAYWELNYKTGKFMFNDQYYKFLKTDVEREGGYEMDIPAYMEAFIPYDSQLIMTEVVKENYAHRSEYNSSFEYKMRRRDGIILDVLVDYYVSYDSNGNLEKSYGTKYNLTRQKDKEKELKKAKNEAQELLKEQNILLSLFDESDSVLFKWKNDENWSVEYVSKSVKTLLGYEVEDFISSKKTYASCIYGPDLQRVIQEIDTVKSKNLNFFKHKSYRVITKDNQEKWVIDYSMVQRDDKGEVTHFIGYIADISELKNTQIKLQTLSITDELTGLYNRRYYNETIIKEIKRSQRNKTSMAFLMLDVDYFKLYNDNYGHAQGDTALAKIAKVLKDFTNREGDYAFRLGGEEFGAIFSCETIEDAKNHATNLLQSIEDLKIKHAYNSASEFVTASVGLVVKKYDDSLSDTELYTQADRALYTAKSSGRNQVRTNKK